MDVCSPSVFPHKLLQDVDGDCAVFSCAVEVLFIDRDSRDDVCLYVTDYTFNRNLPLHASTADWALGLDHRAFKVKLDDVQAKNTRDVTIGQPYAIHNLRFTHGVSGAHGRLGGSDTLVVPLDEPGSEQLKKCVMIPDVCFFPY